MNAKAKQPTEWYDRTNDVRDWMEANPYSRFHWRDLLAECKDMIPSIGATAAKTALAEAIENEIMTEAGKPPANPTGQTSLFPIEDDAEIDWFAIAEYYWNLNE